MELLTLSTFNAKQVGLSKFLPHQVLLKQGKLVRYESSMKAVFFLSHQWTSYDHPDHTGVQLRTPVEMHAFFTHTM